MTQPAAIPRVERLRSRTFRVGFALALSSTAIGAALPVLTRYGALRLDPILFCAGGAVVAALCAIPLLHLRGELLLLFDQRYTPRLVAVSLSGTVLTSATLVYGLRHIDAVAGVILLQAEPIYSLILATLVAGERPSKRQLVATATILLGIGSVFFSGNVFYPPFAALLVLITPLLWQTSHVLGLSVMPPLTPVCITGGRFVFAALFFVPILLVARRESITQLGEPQLLALILLVGIVVYFLSALTWYGAIQRLSLSWTTALVVPGIPLLSIVFAMVFLGERATVREFIGVIIAIGGILALVLGADPHRRMIVMPEVSGPAHQPACRQPWGHRTH